MTPFFTLAVALAMPIASMAATIPSTKPFGLEGREPQEISSIVGGTAASTAEFPYIVSLSSGGSHFCGGVLLNAYTVITAAHCSTGQTPSAVRVRAGSNLWASGGTQVGVSQIVYHPSYSSSTVDSDVAVWRLSSPLAESSTIGYITLPSQGSDPAAGTDLTVAGWGVLSPSSGSLPAALQKVTVPVVSRATCDTQYASMNDITENMFCAGVAAGGKDSCQGDSGGPIVDASGVLQGLVSWGYSCAVPNYSGVYTRVGAFVNWINSNSWTS